MLPFIVVEVVKEVHMSLVLVEMLLMVSRVHRKLPTPVQVMLVVLVLARLLVRAAKA
jgi:hypothetical protein